jgi:hypothetical protein
VTARRQLSEPRFFGVDPGLSGDKRAQLDADLDRVLDRIDHGNGTPELFRQRDELAEQINQIDETAAR